MSETTRMPFDPIPVSGTATADPKPAFSRSVVDTGGLLPPVRKPVSALPSGIAPEAAPPEPNPMPGTPPPNPAAVGGFLRDLLKPTRGKGAVAAGLVSLFAGAYGLNLVMPIQTPPSKPRTAEPEPLAKGPQPSIDIERTSPRATEERNPVIQTGVTEPGKLPPLPPAEAVSPPSPAGFGGGRSESLPPPGGFGSGRTDALPQPTDPRTTAGGGWGSAGSTKTEQPGSSSGALPALPPLPQDNKTGAALPQPGGFGGFGSESPTKPALPALPPPGDNGFRTVGGTLPPANDPKDNTVPPPGGGGTGGLPPLPKAGDPPPSDKKSDVTLPTLPPADKSGAVAPPPAAFGPVGGTLPKADEGPPKMKPTTIEQPGAGKLPDLPAPGPTPTGTLPPPAPSLPAVPVGLKKEDLPAFPSPGEVGSFAPTVRSATPPPAAAPESPPKTDFDVDIVRVRGGDTYSTISDKFYGSTRYAAALRAFNRGADLGQLREVQVPPLHVIRTQAGGRERDIEAPAEPRGVVPAGGIRGPVLDAPVQPNTAPDAVDWGAPGKRR